MPRNYRRNRRAPRRPAPRPARRMRIPRTMRNVQPVFTETWAAAPITLSGNTAFGVLSLDGSSIPQMPDYAAIYRQFRILRCQWILMPRGTSIDPNTQLANITSGANYTNNGRFVYAINNTAGLVAPTSELEVLTDNGCKILSAVRTTPIKISHVPVPNLSIGAPSSLFSTYMNKKRTWLNTNSTGNTGSGLSVPHGGVAYALTLPNTLGVQVVFDVYCRTTLQFKDPA